MDLPNFQGPTVKRGDASYPLHAYQYATSTYDPSTTGAMAPAAIIYLQPDTADSDIELAITYARQADLAIAVRTGGHQYSGSSSTSGNNIQLDLSEGFLDFDLTSKPGYLIAGVSHKLIDFATLLNQNNIFLPMGQCSHVHLGGHVQSGGYGQMCRSFGLLSDNVVGFEIWTAESQGPTKRTVMRDSTASDDVELFFAVLGGSPGNFGIMTRVIFKPLLDADHPNSRGLKIIAPYNSAALKNLYALMADFVQTNDAGFDFCVTSAAATEDYFTDAVGLTSFDSYVKTFYPDEYGRDPNDPLTDLAQTIFPSLIVYVQFSNLGGASEPYDPAFCNKVKAAIAPCGLLHLILQNDDINVPLSKLNFQWIYTGVREFDFPYIKNCQISTQTTFPGWADFAAGWVDTLQNQWINGLMVFTQCQHFGGYNSAMVRNDNGKTAYSWRNATIGMNLDIFYANSNAQALANSFQDQYTSQAIGPDGIFSKADLRWYWASHGEQDLSLVWQDYLSPTSYQRLLQIKKTYDPDSIFSPNAFCVGGAKLSAAIDVQVNQPPPTDDSIHGIVGRAMGTVSAGVQEVDATVARVVHIANLGAGVIDKVNTAMLRAAAAAGQKRSEL